MEHQTATKITQADRQSQSTCCAKSDSSEPEPIYLFRDLHQRIGNRAVGRVVQAKLNISEPGDAHEQEADRVADQVMRMTNSLVADPVSVEPGPTQVQRKCASCAEEELHRKADEEEKDEEPIQRKPFNTEANDPDRAERGIDNISGGEPLPASVRAFFEPRFNYDFSGVRVHTDSRAAESAKSINAQAYTRGSDIVFAAGKYAAGSSTGQRLLAHELTHVVQQASGTKQPRSVQRSVLVEPEDARDEMLALFKELCPSGGFRLAKNLIMSTCPSTSGTGCECLCNVTRDTKRVYNIEVKTADRNSRLEIMHDGVTRRIPDVTASPQTHRGTHPQITMTRASSPMEFSVFSPGCTPVWLPNWRILGHELCGHARLDQTYSGDRGDRKDHDVTIDTENKIAAEHGGDGSAPRGKYDDPRQGEVATNPVGDQSRIVFKLKDGWYYEEPNACLAPVIPVPIPPSTPPAPKPASDSPQPAETDEQEPSC